MRYETYTIYTKYFSGLIDRNWEIRSYIKPKIRE